LINTIEIKMSNTIDHWTRRYYERSDITDRLVHLTRPKDGSVDGCTASVLYEIIKAQKLIGSTTTSGFIVGSTPAVCFQNTPLLALMEAIYSDLLKFERDGRSMRYFGTGLSFDKSKLYKKGARPVFYEETNYAKSLLPTEEHWRIVNLKLDDPNHKVDWTHEREWRIPNDLVFALEDVTLIFESEVVRQKFIQLAKDDNNEHFLENVNGIVVLDKMV